MDKKPTNEANFEGDEDILDYKDLFDNLNDEFTKVNQDKQNQENKK